MEIQREKKEMKGKKFLFLSFLNFLVFSTFFACLLLLTLSSADASSIVNSKHNLSVTGPGSVKSTSERQICSFCHGPHGASIAPLWNQSLSRTPYIVPSWPSLKSKPSSLPDGDSRLCLSCHDGTVAIGTVVNIGGAITTKSMQGSSHLVGGRLSPAASGYIGTDLSGHHPISIEFNELLKSDKARQSDDLEVTWKVCAPQFPVILRPTENRYGGGGSGLGVQCTSCHNPHDDQNGKFLRAGTPDDMTDLCLKCHVHRSKACP